jgi:hypothetical protein
MMVRALGTLGAVLVLCVGLLFAVALVFTVVINGPSRTDLFLVVLAAIGLTLGILGLTRIAYGVHTVDESGLTMALPLRDLRVRWSDIDWYRPLTAFWSAFDATAELWVLIQYRSQPDRRPMKVLIVVPSSDRDPLLSARQYSTVLSEHIPEKLKMIKRTQ